MISIKYQLFLLDPKAEKQDMLLAVDPPFTTPAAIDAIMSTLKFEGKSPFIIIGLEDKIEEFLKAAERADTVDWLDFDLDQRKAALKQLAEEMNLETSEKLRESEEDEQVFGEEDEEEEITAAAKKYPIDLPDANRDIWDAIESQPDFKLALAIMKKRLKEVTSKAAADDYPADLNPSHRKTWDRAMKSKGWKENETHLKNSGQYDNKTVRMALKRNYYEEVCALLGRPAWNRVTKTKVLQDRMKIKGLIIQGEKVGAKLVDKLREHLIHAGMIKKAGSQKFGGVSQHPESNHCMLAHRVEWTMDPAKHSWLQIVSFLKREFKSEAFKESRDRLSTILPQKGAVTTLLEIVKEENNKIGVYINHKLSQEQAATLTQETDKHKIEDKMCGYAKLWYKTGVFPKIDPDDNGDVANSNSGLR